MPFWFGFNSSADLRDIRRQAGLTQAQLGALAGFSRQSVSHHENMRGAVTGVAARKFRETLTDIGMRVPGWGEPPMADPWRTTSRTHCGAKTRNATPCQCRAMPSGRCRFHGGLSTGPKTQQGRERIAAAQRARHARERESRAVAQRAVK